MTLSNFVHQIGYDPKIDKTLKFKIGSIILPDYCAPQLTWTVSTFTSSLIDQYKVIMVDAIEPKVMELSAFFKDDQANTFPSALFFNFEPNSSEDFSLRVYLPEDVQLGTNLYCVEQNYDTCQVSLGN